MLAGRVAGCWLDETRRDEMRLIDLPTAKASQKAIAKDFCDRINQDSMEERSQSAESY